MARHQETENQTINLLGTGTTVNGDIVANGDIRIDGVLKGSIETKGKVVIGASGLVEGDIICKNADISGIVTANIRVNELLSLKSSAKINGDIVTGKLAIEPGAVFTGSCNMHNENSTFVNAPKETNSKESFISENQQNLAE